jgi:two-component system chemotaxis response regulator CheB
VGTSAGAVTALAVILPALPADYALPIVIALHIPAGSNATLVELFQPKCQMQLKEAEDKEPLSRGTIYFAPPDYHLLVEKDRRLSLSTEAPVNFSRPSIDVLFESAADAFGRSLLAIVLTGANDDGARGVAAVCAAGGKVVVQSPDTAEARAMPAAALAACVHARSLSLQDIAELLRRRAS